MDVSQFVTEKYRETLQSTIKMTPVKASLENMCLMLERVENPKGLQDPKAPSARSC